MKNNDKNTGSIRFSAIKFLIYGLMSTIFTVVLILLFAVLIEKEILPDSSVDSADLISVAISSMIFGCIASRAMGSALLTSVFQGLCNFAINYIMGIFVFARIVPQNINLYYLLACMVGAVVGGIFAAGRKPRHRKIKK